MKHRNNQELPLNLLQRKYTPKRMFSRKDSLIAESNWYANDQTGNTAIVDLPRFGFKRVEEGEW